ncbi:glycogen synthase GlgA [Rivibacter subsaxonicus]|uniref:Glycogen synthase n=1 Tax=Rivibacter subsaxonicus TaxID=457575 RepID=A0A4Q7VZU8_9BURK|nr:glycogen synthase GlgA [Rivibacter subsaxonicus]RZU02397.1 starch synthase [Rivibacter subsaxonicus]
MRVLQLSAEIYPLLKTGGLADVAAALPQALRAAGCEVRLLLPGFPAILAGLADARPVAELKAPWGERGVLHAGRLPAVGGLPAYVIDVPTRLGEGGHPYTDAGGRPHADSHLRFGWLGFAAARIAAGADADWRPRIVHGHDWHAGLAGAYLALEPSRPRSVFTIHNLAYQGLFESGVMVELGLPARLFDLHQLEFHGRLSFMKGGLVFADAITTVSPSYAREILTPEQGCGLDGLLRTRAGALHGILNGVDDAVWNPATDAAIVAPFDADRLDAKASCRLVLQQELGLRPQAQAPLFGMVSRLAEQKGLQLLLDALPALLAQPEAQLAVLGSGDAGIEAALRAAAEAHPGRVAVRFGVDEALAHRLFAGSDVTLVPSRFEPCGLTQMYGLRYGSLPLVRRVGGLADTVVDSTLEDLADDRATGFVFDAFSAEALARALRRACVLFARPDEWRAVQQRGMQQRFGWDVAAARYAEVYRELLEG